MKYKGEPIGNVPSTEPSFEEGEPGSSSGVHFHVEGCTGRVLPPEHSVLRGNCNFVEKDDQNTLTPPENLRLKEAVQLAMRERGLTVRSTADALELSPTTVNNLRNGRSVRLLNLWKFVDLINGERDQWTKLAMSGKDAETMTPSLLETGSVSGLDPAVLNLARALVEVPGRLRMPLEILVAGLASPSTNAQHYVPILRAFGQLSTPTQKVSLGLQQSVGYMGPDCPGLVKLLTSKVVKLGGQIDDSDCAVRADLASVCIRFTTQEQLPDSVMLESCKTLESDVKALLVTEGVCSEDSVNEVRLLVAFGREKEGLPTRKRFGFHFLLENCPGVLYSVLGVLKDSRYTVTDIKVFHEDLEPDRLNLLVVTESLDLHSARSGVETLAMTKIAETKDRLHKACDEILQVEILDLGWSLAS